MADQARRGEPARCSFLLVAKPNDYISGEPSNRVNTPQQGDWPWQNPSMHSERAKLFHDSAVRIYLDCPHRHLRPATTHTS